MSKRRSQKKESGPFSALYWAVNGALLQRHPQIRSLAERECVAVDRALESGRGDASRMLPDTYIGYRPKTELEKLLAGGLYSTLGTLYAFRRPGQGGFPDDMQERMETEILTAQDTQAALHHCWMRLLDYQQSDLKRIVSGTGRDLWMALALHENSEDAFDCAVMNELHQLGCPPSLRQDLDGDTVWSYLTQYNSTKKSKLDVIDAVGAWAMREGWNVADFGPMDVVPSASERKTEHRARTQHWVLARELHDHVLPLEQVERKDGRLMKM